MKYFDAAKVYSSPYPDELPGHNSTDTSTEAAKAIKGKANHLQEIVYCFIAARGPSGSTASEASEALGRWRDTVGPRLTELKEAGYVVDSGLRRKSPRGKNEIVWVTVETDRQYEIL